jgi:hypothetical protein
MPAHHDVRSSDIFTRRLHGTLATTAEQGQGLADLLLTPGVGARTVQSLAMVAEIVRARPTGFRTPPPHWRMAAGPSPLPGAAQSLRRDGRVLKTGIQKARRLATQKRCKRSSALITRRVCLNAQHGALLSSLCCQGRAASALDGRSVFGWEADLMPGSKARPDLPNSTDHVTQ